MTIEPIALDGEPTFTLMGRDPFAPVLVRLWAEQRRIEVRAGTRPVSDLDQIERAERTAERMQDWRRDADEAWRQPRLALDDVDTPLSDPDGTLYTPQPVADKDGWISWGGGECPVPDQDNTKIEYEMRNGRIEGPYPASYLAWGHKLRGMLVAYEIVRYRVVTP